MASEIAAAVLFLVAFIEHAKDKTFSPYPFVCLSVLLFFCGTFLAWSHECNAKEFLENKVAQLEKRLTDVPHLCVIQRGFYADSRTLSEQLGSIVRPVAEVSCLHVKFKNNPTLSIESSIARNILAEVEFVDESGHLLCAFLGRWGDTAQLSYPQDKVQHKYWRMIDFGIGQGRELDIAFKYQDEAECFGMSSETYQYKDWKHPKQKLVQENIKARVRLRGVNVDSTWDFWFQNPKSAGLQKIKFQEVTRK